LADYEEKYLTPDGEAAAEPTRRKANKSKAMPRFSTELCRQADDEVQIVRELNTEEAQIIREKHILRRAERRAVVAPEERNQAR
jgi:hypothetical protein